MNKVNIIAILLIVITLAILVYVGVPGLLKVKKVSQAPSHAIDLVYLWVDGSELSHVQALESETGEIKQPKHRFADHNELLYSLRSVWKFAPWINHIYIVSADYQIPLLIDYRHEKITFVSHSMIFKEHSHALPVFNAMCIETRIHHIPGLSEHFIYSNDDMFLGSPVTPDFFFEDGKPIHRIIANVPADMLSFFVPSDEHLVSITNVNNPLLNEIKTDSNRPYFDHQMQPFKKSTYEACHVRFEPMWDLTTYQKFRTCFGIVPPQLVMYYSMYMQSGIKLKINFLKHPVATLCDFKPINDLFLRGIKKKKPNLFCLNDFCNKLDYSKTLKQFLESYFPEAAPWEVET